MALKASIHKARVTLSDMDRSYFDELQLTIARHPSETLERMMLRLLVFCFHADRQLVFTKGLSTPDEPDLWRIGDDGRILEWIELGQPTLERVKKGCGVADAVWLYTYGRSTDIWWRQQGADFLALPKLTIWRLADRELQELTALADKKMTLTVTITESVAYVSDDSRSVTVNLYPVRCE